MSGSVAKAGAGAARLHLDAICNNGCVFCARSASGTEHRAPVIEQLAIEAKGARAGVARALYLVGGEPTLHQGLAGLIRDARAAGFGTVVLQTNGRRLSYMAYTRELVEAGLAAVEVSLHGPREEIHDYHTRVPGSFRQTVRGTKNARKAGLRVAMTTVVTRSGFRHLREQVLLAARLGVEAVHLALAIPRGAAREQMQRVVPRWEAVVPYLALAAGEASRLALPLAVSAIPTCLLSDIAVRSLEREIPEAFPPGLYPEERCADCAHRPECNGVDAVYVQRYGFTELKPRKLASHGDSVPGAPLPQAELSLFAGPWVIE